MGGLWLASAGDDIKLWDCDHAFSLVHTFNPHCNRNIASLAWNLKRSLLASCALDSEQVVLTYTRDSVLTNLELPCGAGVQCTDFSSASRFLLCGGAEGVSVWDLKTMGLKKSFQEHKGPVTAARYNWNSNYIASGSETGEIILHNTQTGQSNHPMVAPSVQAIRQLEYSALKKCLLGTASDDGGVCLWDCNSRRLLHAFKGTHAHVGPATGLAFSPVNDVLMMSVGLDKRLVCYDIQQKQAVKVFEAQSPLTCVDLMPDGVTVAVGSTRGKVYIYDLRQGGSTPIHTFQAHKTSVQSVKFMPTVLSKIEESSGGEGKTIVSSNSSSTRRQLPSAPSIMQDITPSKTGQTPDTSSVLQPVSPNPTVDIFSPTLAQDDQSRVHSKSTSQINLTANLREGTFSGVCHTDVFSPMAKGSAEVSAVSLLGAGAHRDSSYFSLQLGQNLTGGHVSQNVTGGLLSQNVTGGQLSQNLTGGQLSQNLTGGHLSHNMTAGHLSHLQLSGTVHTPVVDQLSHPRMCSSLQSSAVEGGLSVGGGGAVPSSLSAGVTGLGVPSLRSLLMADAGDAAQNRSTGSASPDSAAISGGEEGQGGGSHDSSSSSSLPAPTTTYHHYLPSTTTRRSRAEPVEVGVSGGAEAVQQELLRGLVADAMEDVRDDLHRDIQGLQLAMLRQFHNFEREMQASLGHYTDRNQQLLLYVRQLEEENKRLKKNY